MIPYGRQSISDEDVAAVEAVLRSDFLTQGPAVPAFEAAVAGHCGAAHAIAVNSATSALHIACLALGVGPGDLVWTSPVTFVASANCALYCGAEVDFVDIDPRTFNMSVDALAAKLAKAEASGRLPKVVIPVHLAGQSCDMAGIRALGDRYGFRIIEDASHAVGADYRDVPVGRCTYSDIAIFSFHPVKIVTTAEGGIALTNDSGLAGKMALLRTHGITRDPAEMESESHGPWYYEQVDLGFNYRMTEMQAALGSSQMSRLTEFVARRREIAAIYDDAFANEPIAVQWQEPDTASSWHLYVIRLRGADMGRRAEAFAALREAGLGVNLHYMPVYLQPYYRRLGFEPGLCPEAEAYYRESISIPLYAGMSDADVETVIAAVKAVARG
ncbi:MAG TPA: UDP-4-amino-4,6-dideoxy-N-acetyl-beta-L-altrosamine transaminase [Allosphingosinicella sp.]